MTNELFLRYVSRKRNHEHLEEFKKSAGGCHDNFFTALSGGLGQAKSEKEEKAKTNEGAAHFAAGVQAADQRQYDQAIIEFTKAIEIDPKDIPAIENRAYMYLALQKNAEAVADFTQVIELAPGQTTSYLGRGQAETNLKQFEPALTDLSKAIELKPDDPNAYRFRGFANIGKADWNAAIADYDKAIEMNPQDEQAYVWRAFAKRSLRNYQDALVDYTKAIEINPNDADAFDKRGYCYSLIDQWQKAIDDYQAALAIKPNEPDTVARLRFAQRQIASPPVAASIKPTPERQFRFSSFNRLVGIAPGRSSCSWLLLYLWFVPGGARLIDQSCARARNFFDSAERAVSLPTLFRRTRKSPMVVQAVLTGFGTFASNNGEQPVGPPRWRSQPGE